MSDHFVHTLNIHCWLSARMHMLQKHVHIHLVKHHGFALVVPSVYQGKRLLKKFHFKQGWTCKKDRNQAGMRKLRNTTLLRNDGGLFSDLQCNALAYLVHFTRNKVNQGSKCIAFEAIKEAAIIPNQSDVLEISHPCLVSVNFVGPSIDKIILLYVIHHWNKNLIC